MSTLALALAYIAVSACALAMNAHHRTVFGRAPSSRAALGFRVTGYGALAGAAFAAASAYGWAVGVVAWIAMLGVAGFVLTQLLAFAPRLLALPAAALLVSAVVALSLSLSR